MNFTQIARLTSKPQLYEKGSAVMWTDPYISGKLLELHLNPDHDIASRSTSKIEMTVGWILQQSQKPRLEILDLGCGPGLYAELLAQKGHSVTGVDFSENTVRYAVEQAKTKNLAIKYLNKNYLELEFENQFDLVMMIFLDFCVLLPAERNKVLDNIYRALKPGGLFVFDVVNDKNTDKKIMPQSWDAQEKGFWKDSPYLVLNNGYHFSESGVFANHHIVIGTQDTIDTYIFWNHYYSPVDLVPILQSKGFSGIKNHENVLPDEGNYFSGENITFYVAGKV